jgi:hypothetical protein
MQAITTKFISPTNTRGSRYKATCEAGSLTVECDHSLNSEDNHKRAARLLIRKLGWFHDEKRGDAYGRWFGGGTKDGYVFVCAVSYAEINYGSGVAHVSRGTCGKRASVAIVRSRKATLCSDK